MYDICCVGHITKDKIVTTKSTVYMAGGTAIYFSNAIKHMDIQYVLVTALANEEIESVEQLRSNNIHVNLLPSTYTVYFENIYGENQDKRTQRVIQKADAFSVNQLDGLNAKVFHLGPLLADDIPVNVIQTLAAKAKVSLDVQGYLREVRNQNVYPVDWQAKQEALPHIHTLKANEHEMESLTGHSNVIDGAKILASWGVKEVVITLGSMGSVIYAEGIFYNVPAYKPKVVTDATGCGDTYMAGYLYQRLKGTGIQESGEFAAAMATLKIETYGPFTGTELDVLALLNRNV